MEHWLEITESNTTTTTTAALSIQNAFSGQSALSMASEFEEGRKEMQQWLVSKVGLPSYYNRFVLNGYESLKFIQDIEGEHELEELGILFKGHKRRIMAEIDALKRRNEPDYDQQIEDMEDEWRQMEEAEEKADEEKAVAMGFVSTISTMNVEEHIDEMEEKENIEMNDDNNFNDDDDVIVGGDQPD